MSGTLDECGRLGCPETRGTLGQPIKYEREEGHSETRISPTARPLQRPDRADANKRRSGLGTEAGQRFSAEPLPHRRRTRSKMRHTHRLRKSERHTRFCSRTFRALAIARPVKQTTSAGGRRPPEPARRNAAGTRRAIESKWWRKESRHINLEFTSVFPTMAVLPTPIPTWAARSKLFQNVGRVDHP